MKAKKINESKDVTIGAVNFNFHVDTDPLRARFLARTSADLDKLDNEKAVDAAIAAIETELAKATGIKWSHDAADPGAGYSFIPDEQALAQKIEASFQTR